MLFLTWNTGNGGLWLADRRPWTVHIGPDVSEAAGRGFLIDEQRNKQADVLCVVFHPDTCQSQSFNKSELDFVPAGCSTLWLWTNQITGKPRPCSYPSTLCHCRDAFLRLVSDKIQMRFKLALGHISAGTKKVWIIEFSLGLGNMGFILIHVNKSNPDKYRNQTSRLFKFWTRPQKHSFKFYSPLLCFFLRRPFNQTPFKSLLLYC